MLDKCQELLDILHKEDFKTKDLGKATLLCDEICRIYEHAYVDHYKENFKNMAIAAYELRNNPYWTLFIKLDNHIDYIEIYNSKKENVIYHLLDGDHSLNKDAFRIDNLIMNIVESVTLIKLLKSVDTEELFKKAYGFKELPTERYRNKTLEFLDIETLKVETIKLLDDLSIYRKSYSVSKDNRDWEILKEIYPEEFV